MRNAEQKFQSAAGSNRRPSVLECASPAALLDRAERGNILNGYQFHEQPRQLRYPFSIVCRAPRALKAPEDRRTPRRPHVLLCTPWRIGILPVLKHDMSSDFLRWDMHLKSGYPSNERFTGIGDAEERTFGCTVGSDDVIAIVRKPLARCETRHFANDTVSLHHYCVAPGINDDPFTAAYRNRLVRPVLNSNKINKRERAIRRRFQRRHVDHLIDRHANVRKLSKHALQFVRRRSRIEKK